jgi:hypothetical protein
MYIYYGGRIYEYMTTGKGVIYELKTWLPLVSVFI